METLLVYTADSTIIRTLNEAFGRSFVVRDVAEERWVLSILASEVVAAVVIDCALANASAMCARIRRCCFQPLLAIATGLAPETRAALLQAGADVVLLRPVFSAGLRLGLYPWLPAQPFGAHRLANHAMSGAPPANSGGMLMPLRNARFDSTQTQRRVARFARASLDA